MVQWEYDFVHMYHEGPNLDFGDLLKKFQLAAEALGKEGWELVSVLHLQCGFQGFFKRAKFSKSEPVKIKPAPTTVPTGAGHCPKTYGYYDYHCGKRAGHDGDCGS